MLNAYQLASGLSRSDLGLAKERVSFLSSDVFEELVALDNEGSGENNMQDVEFAEQSFLQKKKFKMSFEGALTS